MQTADLLDLDIAPLLGRGPDALPSCCADIWELRDAIARLRTDADQAAVTRFWRIYQRAGVDHDLRSKTMTALTTRLAELERGSSDPFHESNLA